MEEEEEEEEDVKMEGNMNKGEDNTADKVWCRSWKPVLSSKHGWEGERE